MFIGVCDDGISALVIFFFSGSPLAFLCKVIPMTGRGTRTDSQPVVVHSFANHNAAAVKPLMPSGRALLSIPTSDWWESNPAFTCVDGALYPIWLRAALSRSNRACIASHQSKRRKPAQKACRGFSNTKTLRLLHFNSKLLP